MSRDAALVTDFDSRPLRELTINDILANRAAHFGDRTFLWYGEADRSLSFAELNRIANAIGNSLLGAGISPQHTVSVMMHNPLAITLAHYGINKAGAVFSPINYDYKGDPLAYQLTDTAPAMLFLEDRYIPRINEIKDSLDSLPEVVVYRTGADSEELDAEFTTHSFAAFREGDPSEPGVSVTWRDTASIFYTSGTTGFPKGCPIPHRYVLAHFGELWYPLLTPEDTVHCAMPLFHTGGLYFLCFSGLVAGSQVALWDKVSTADFWDRIETYDATYTALLEIILTWLMKQPARPDDRQNTLNKVQMQPLPEDYDVIAERFGFDFVTSGFGQTELGYSTVSLVHAAQGEAATPPDLRRGHSPDQLVQNARRAGIPVVEEAPGDRFIGKPRERIVEATILNDDDEHLPPGEVGELAFRPTGPGLLFEEYLGKPQQTIEAWRNLWFHSGDLGYRDEAGNFYFVDRKADTIRRRGENISSVQVQEIVNKHDAVAQTAAVAVPAREGGEDEVGIAVQLKHPDAITEEGLRSFLTEEMPQFMIPKYIEFVESFPTTETNKIEKYKLRELIIERHSLAG